VQLLEPSTGFEFATLSAHQRLVKGVAFSPSGLMLASIGGDGAIKLWPADFVTRAKK
jgi:WD40 repeat protein